MSSTPQELKEKVSADFEAGKKNFHDALAQSAATTLVASRSALGPRPTLI